MAGPRPWPVEIRVVSAEKVLEVDYDDGKRFRLPAEFLRVHSPSADVKGHGPGQEVTVFGKRDVGIAGVEPVGNYAVRLLFDDGHDTGLYSWDYLYELGANQDVMWDKYLKNLEAQRLSREP